jgi:hypothetical protein
MRRSTNIEYHIEKFKKAREYYKNAKEKLKESPVQYGRYTNEKVVREAMGLCYLAVLEAVNGFLLKSGVERKQLPKSIDACGAYLKKYAHKDGELITRFHSAYNLLHVLMYYRGITDEPVVKGGFGAAKFVVEKLTERKV